MSSTSDKKYILNLDPGIDERIKEMVQSHGFEFLEDLNEDLDKNDLKLILAADLKLLEQIYEEEELLEYDVRSILTSHTDEIDLFTSLNGEFIFGELGHENCYELLNKYLAEQLNIHLIDSVQDDLEDYYKFNVMKASSIGIYLDEVTLFFERHKRDGHRARFFIDYILFFLFSLRKMAEIGVPIELELGKKEECILLNINLSTHELANQDFWNALTNESAQCSHLKNLLLLVDFLEVTRLEEPEKINIMACWEEGEGFHNNLSLRTLKRSSSDIDYISESNEFLLGSSSIEQGNGEVTVSELSEESLDAILAEEGLSLDELDDDFFSGDDIDEDSENIGGEGSEEEESQTVSGGEEEDKDSQTVSGGEDDDDSQTISGDDIIEDDGEIIDLSEENVKKLEIIRKVSGMESDEDFIRSISSSFKDEIKNEIIRISTAENEEDRKLDMMKVLTSVTDKANEKGIFKDGGHSYLKTLLESKQMDKVLSLLSLDSIPSSDFATFLDGSQDDRKQVVKVVNPVSEEQEKEIKKANIEKRIMKEKYELEIKRLEKAIGGKEQQLVSIQKSYAKKSELAQNEILRLKELLAAGGSAASSRKVKETSAEDGSLSINDPDVVKVMRELEKSKKMERTRGREINELRKQVGKLTTKLKEQTIKQSKRGALSMRERVLEGNLKQAQAGLVKLKKENTLLKQKMMTLSRGKN